MSCLFQVKILDVEGKGRGVFLDEDVITKGALVHEAPIIELDEREHNLVKQTELFNYTFNWRNKGCAVALGLGSLFNDSPFPNLSYQKDYANRKLIFKAIRDIRKGEELLIDYGKIWFETEERKQLAKLNAELDQSFVTDWPPSDFFE